MIGIRKAQLAGSLLLVLSASASHAGVVRHDRDVEYHEALAQSSTFQAAGRLDLGQSLFGSATLIARDWILTAAHATEVTSASQLRFVIGGRTYTGAESVEHPLWQGAARVTEGYDIALVRLSEPVAGITPARLYRGDTVVGREAVLVGAGLSGDGLSGQTLSTGGVMRAGMNVIDSTADTLGAFLPGVALSSNNLAIDFDSPLSSVLNRTGDTEPLDREFFPGQGDSGGAYWVETVAGDWRLASIQSWGTLNQPGDNFGRYGNIAFSASLYDEVVYDWVHSYIPSPGATALFGIATIALARHRRGTIECMASRTNAGDGPLMASRSGT